jgi:hypothetical protein
VDLNFRAPLLATLLWWSAAFSSLRRFRHQRGLAKSSLSEEYRRIMVWLETPASRSKGCQRDRITRSATAESKGSRWFKSSPLHQPVRFLRVSP